MLVFPLMRSCSTRSRNSDSSRPVEMTTWVKPGSENWLSIFSNADAVTGPTPLSADFMHQGILPDVKLVDMLLGNIGGTIGETSALMLLAGAIYLLWRGVIRIRIPAAFIATVAVISYFFPQGGNDPLQWMLYELLGGGLIRGAFFMEMEAEFSKRHASFFITYVIKKPHVHCRAFLRCGNG